MVRATTPHRRIGGRTARPSGALVSPAVDPEVALRELLGRIAPGTALRDGLERILAGRTGALIVLGYDRVVESLCTGGFALDVALSATRRSEEHTSELQSRQYLVCRLLLE